MLQFVIQKSFEGPELRVFQSGELVDAETWRNRDKLIRQRYLRPATADEVASAEPAQPVYIGRKRKAAPVATRRA